MANGNDHHRRDQSSELYFNAAKLFAYLRKKRNVDPTRSVLNWSFHFESVATISDELIDSLVELLGDEFEADEDAIRAEVHVQGFNEPDLDGQGNTELALIFTGVVRERRLASLHLKFAQLSQQVGISYCGVTCLEDSGGANLENLIKWTDGVLETTAKWKIEQLAWVAPVFRDSHLGQLNDLGLETTDKIPNAHERGFSQVRPKPEIVRRLMATLAAFAWVCAPDEIVHDETVMRYIQENELNDGTFSLPEAKWIATPRNLARQFAVEAGWMTEYMWSLAWLLGYPPTPNPCPEQVTQEIIVALRDGFLGGFDSGFDELMNTTRVRSLESIITLEDLLYCAHNAMFRIGNVDSTRIVQERRHSLTWSLSPGVTWEQTDVTGKS